MTVGEAVERAVSGEWDVPEFQRQFVWQPSQVCGLADSLWRNYPIGALLLWRSANSGGDPRRSRWWIADGQQRLTSLCILCGREPVWLRRKSAEFRTRLMKRFDLCFHAGGDSTAGFSARHNMATHTAMGRSAFADAEHVVKETFRMWRGERGTEQQVERVREILRRALREPQELGRSQ